MWSLLLYVAVILQSASSFPLSPSSHYLIEKSALNISKGSAFQAALRDLKRDWYKVIGGLFYEIKTAPIMGKATATDSILIFMRDHTAPPESYTVVAAPASPKCGAPSLTITGADELGLLFGLYHVSTHFLSVDPFWWFIDVQPRFVGGVDVPTNFTYSSGAPAFYSRGAFFNDEDTSGFFFADPLGESVYSVSAASFYAETLLRLRANTIIPSTFGYIDERHYRVAAARGLKLGNHHVMPLGNNVFAWPKGVPYWYRLNPEPFHAAWSAVVDYALTQERRDMVFSLGYRGVNDEPFWSEDVDCQTVECRGGTISAAIGNQSALAHAAAAAAGAPPPHFVAYLWAELLELQQAGTLVVPPDVHFVFTDYPGSFNIQGVANASAGDGFYAHIAMMNGHAGQITEFIPLARIFRNIWEFWVRGATSYGMINLSDMKQVPITAEAVFRYLWNPADFNNTLAPVTPDAAATAFYNEWSIRHYGATAGPAVAALWGRYFALPYMAKDDCSTDCDNFGDHFLGDSLLGTVTAFQTEMDSPSAVNAAILASAAAFLNAFGAPVAPILALLWADTNAVAATVAASAGADGARLFAGHSLLQTAVHHFHVQAFLSVAAGAAAWARGDSAAAVTNVTAALASLDAILAALRAGESGVWSGVYEVESWTWCVGSRANLAHLVATLSRLDSAAPPSWVYPDYAMMTYECGGEYGANSPNLCATFPLATFDASVAFDIFVRTACALDVPVGAVPRSTSSSSSAFSKCESTFTGATIHGRAGAQIALFVVPNVKREGGPFTIRFTLDGSPVTHNADAFTIPFFVTSNTTIRAQSFDSTGTALGVPIFSKVAVA